MNTPTQKSEEISGISLYRSVWQTVSDLYFDRSRLTGWDSWKHKFDDVIDSISSSLPYIDQMLASLNDQFTERLKDATLTAQVVESNLNQTAQVAEVESVLGVLRSDGIGYLGIRTFDRDDITTLVFEAAKKIAACEGFVLDLRDNVGGLLRNSIDICNLLLREGRLCTQEFREDNQLVTRQFFLNDYQYFFTDTSENGSRKTVVLNRLPQLLADKPVVILITNRTCSASELVTAALVENGAEGKVSIVGSGPTPGKGIGQFVYSLLDGTVKIKITSHRWLSPSGQWLGDCGQTAQDGIEPNITLEKVRSRECVLAGFSEVARMLGREMSFA